MWYLFLSEKFPSRPLDDCLWKSMEKFKGRVGHDWSNLQQQQQVSLPACQYSLSPEIIYHGILPICEKFNLFFLPSFLPPFFPPSPFLLSSFFFFLSFFPFFLLLFPHPSLLFSYFFFFLLYHSERRNSARLGFCLVQNLLP